MHRFLAIKLKISQYKKASTFENIPSNILRASKQSCWETLAQLSSITLLTYSFPTELKVSDVNPVFKKDGSLKTKNSRSVCMLPVVSKIFERLLHKQISLHVPRLPTFTVTKKDLEQSRH